MKRLISLIWVCVLSIGLSIPVFAADTATTTDVNLSWQANTESDLAGYKIYRSLVPGEYSTTPLVVLDKIKLSYIDVVTRAATDVRYFYVATAFDTADPAPVHESARSAEVSKLIPALAPIQKPGILVLTVVPNAIGEITVTWPDVGDGVGGKAKVNIRYASSPIHWGIMTSAVCENSPCKITGLPPDELVHVRGVPYRASSTGNIFGTITEAISVMTLGDGVPNPPQGITISKSDGDEVLLLASLEDCKELTTSAVGSSNESHKLSIKCIK